MKVLYLSQTAIDAGKLDISPLKNQNKYRVMYSLNEKLELVTTQQVTDYHCHKGENSKLFIWFSSAQMQNAIASITDTLTKEKGFTFKFQKDTL